MMGKKTFPGMKTKNIGGSTNLTGGGFQLVQHFKWGQTKAPGFRTGPTRIGEEILIKRL